MNLLHLKYAVEVDRTQSISKAAENLYMNQPNLSRAIKELEESLGITVFKRTPKGMKTTPQGEEFLVYAKRILSQVDEVEAMYKQGKGMSEKFSISVPRADYLGAAFNEFVKEHENDKSIDFTYRETNAMRAIDNILQADYRLGIIRYQTGFDSYFKTLLYEKDLAFKVICQFECKIIVSKDSPLTKKKEISLEDLINYTEIAYADPYVPSLPFSDVKKAEMLDFSDKRIFVFERASQLDLLSSVKNTFLWASSIPDNTLNRYELAQLSGPLGIRKYTDLLVYKNGYHLTKLDTQFIEKVNKYAQNVSE